MSIEYENQLNNYIRMFENELRNLTATPNDWLKFLYSACHNYKLDFKELVLVNTTFPNSTAVLPKKAWVEKFGRMIDKNAVAIPSIVFNGSNSRVKLYYDISQTIETEKSKPVPLWKYDIKDEQSIVTALNKKFGLKAKSFETVIAGAINILAKSNSENNYQILKNVYRKATISRYDNARKIHSDIVAKSAMAVICSRCGFDITKIFNFGDFREVTYYDSSQAAVALGNATFGTAKSILQIISYTIQKERVLNNGKRNNNSLWSGVRQGQRGILDANSPTPEIGVEYVGNGKERISENEQSSRIRYDADVRGNLYPPRNNSDSGTGEVRNIDRAEERSIGSNRGTQGERLAQVGSVGERHSGRSSSGSSRRNDLHLNEENLKSNTEAEVIDNSSAFSISQEQINKIITEGSGVVNGKYRIYEQFAKDETLKDNAQFLKNEYGIGGKSSAATYNHIGVDWDGKGLLLANKNTENKILLKWEKVAKIISYLIKTDGYLNSAEKQGYIDYKKAKELPAEKQKEAEIPAEELELAYSVGKKCYIGADEYKIIGITDNTVSLFDSRYPLLSTDMSKEEFEKKITENRQFNEHLFVKKSLDKDLFFNNLDKESFTYIYYNPDADSGGQFVITEIPYEQVIEASKKYPDNTSEFFDYIVSVGRQTAVDVDSEFFRDSLDKYNSNSHFAEGLTDDVKNQLTNIALSVDTNFNQKGYYDSYSEIQSENPDAIILFRVGDFYEVLRDNAQEVAEALNLTLMSRTINGEKIPMVGFPSSYLEDNENLLVEIGYKILTVEPEDIAERASLRNKAQEVAKQNNLPFSDKFSMGFEDDFDTAVYDGSMSADDYEKLQQADIEPKADRPTITCDWSEHPAFEDGKTYSVADFDRIMKSADDEWVRLRQYEQDTYGNDMDAIYQAYEDGEIDGVHQGYAKTKFIINMPDGTKYTERQDIGDGDGGVIDFLRQYDNYKNLVPILEQERDNEPSLLTPVYGEEFVKEVEEQSDNLSAQQKREDVIFSSDGKNYVITDDNFADGTKSERYANNINAIKTLKEIESSNRQATPAEQEILAKYVGWGGLDSYFKAENNAQLKALLNDDEYKAALASTLTSFYTPPAVIRAVYNALNNLGFKTGNILEPSCGVGNFMGLCPTNMSDSKFYGVELDDISGRIASKLYPQANIAVQGFETTNLPDNFFDAAVGNVPFAQLKVLDKKYDKYNFLIHDYFFAKTLDKVRPGGIIAFITSKGTMDKKSSKVRKYIAQRAELLGAIRLPNDTFSKTAGTEVTSDILILKKRERMIDIEPDWVHLGTDDNGITINSYFVEHPEMILGEMQEVSGAFGAKAECIAYENANLEDLLNEAVSNIDGEYKAQAIERLFEDTEDDEDADLIPATPDVKNFSYTVVDGDIYYRQNSIMEKQKVNKTAEKRIKALVKVREALREVLNNQLEDMPDEIIANSQRKLNVIYDRFVNEYGYINSKANMKAFEKDNSINLLASLEKFDSEKNYKGKSDIFSKRTIQPHKAVDKVDTASDALAVSISEKAKIDLEYMSQLYGKSVNDIIDELEGVIFNVPGTDIYQTADEYLSGNVREKLRTALSYSYDKPEQYDCNITALKAVQPVDLTATEIDVRLGATWLPVDVVRDFMYETIGTPRYIRDSIDVSYSEYNSEWRISHKSFDKSVNAVSTYGTKRINAYKILEDTLNLRDVKIFDNVFEDGKGVVFATGTPISNSMTELYTMQRYLQYNKLVDLGLSNFDAWASTFGETVTALELSPEGNGYRMKTRFAKFFNLPELMSTFREIANIKTADVLDLDVPEVERHNVLTKPSEQQKEIIAGIGDRADKVHSGDVDPSVDNMLKITNDGRKLALDQRLINPMLPDFEGSKLNVCADNIFSLWDKTKEDRLAQMVFCDISTPNGAGKFNVYDELKAKLIAKGIPENEIAFIHDAKTNQQKQDIFSQVRSGKIRVIIGSTSKMGAGTNCQDKLIALHHLDCPWRPSDLQQREGRIIRQGNKNSLVHIYSYLTENTFDAYLYQLVENKQKFISQIMTSKSPVRSAEDIDELQLSYAVAKALCSGNPLIKEKMDLDIEVSKLQLLKANFLSVKYELEDQIASTFPQKISSAKYNVEKIKSDIELAKSHINDDFALKIKGITYNDKKEAGQQLLLACDKSIGSDKVRIGEYKGFILDLRFDAYHSNKYILTLNGSAHYDVELGQDIFGNVTRIDNVLKSLPGELEKAKNELSKVESDCDSAKEAVNTTFDKEEELNTKLARLKELNTILEVDNSSIKKNEDTADNNEDDYYYAKVNEKQKDILFSEGYKDFAPSDDGGKFIVKYPAADKVKVQQLLNNNAIKL